MNRLKNLTVMLQHGIEHSEGIHDFVQDLVPVPACHL